jgi:hypothetical protein
VTRTSELRDRTEVVSHRTIGDATQDGVRLTEGGGREGAVEGTATPPRRFETDNQTLAYGGNS